MKTSILLVPVLAAFFAVVTCFVYDGLRGPSTGVGTDAADRLDDLIARLDRVERRLEATARLESPPVASPDAVAVDPGVPSVASGSTSTVAIAVPGDGPDGSSPEAPRPGDRLAKLLRLEGGEEELRGYVASVIEDERAARDDRRHLERQERAREFQEMRQGPYGRHNYRVNSMAKKLALTPDQADVYYDLLVRYGDEKKNLHKTEDGKSVFETLNPMQMAEHMKNVHAQEQTLAKQLDAEFADSLSDEQLAAYEALPEHERGMPGGDFSVAVSTGDGVFSTGSPVGVKAIHISGFDVLDGSGGAGESEGSDGE